MILTRDVYVPSVRWRQGEYQALHRLKADMKNRIVPLIAIPEIEFDFEEWKPKKTVQQHVHPFVARYNLKWGVRSAWITVNKKIIDLAMDDGRDIYSYVFDGLRPFEGMAVPAIPLDVQPLISQAVKEISRRDGRGVGILIRIEDLMKPDLKDRISKLAEALTLDFCHIDLIVDLGAPNYEPYATFIGALIVSLRKLDVLNLFRNFVLIGTAIPETFKGVAKGKEDLPRHDWLFYKELLGTLPKDVRTPNYGDYTVVHPDFSPVDMRKIKSSGKIIYTNNNTWTVHKGGSFRDNPEQMHDHCAALVSSPNFRGAHFSNGDDYIHKCSVLLESYSNQTRWKEVAINHHVTQVIDDLSILFFAT